MNDVLPQPPATKVARRPRLVLAAAAALLTALVLLASGEAARTNSATWDETLYLFLGRQALLTNDYSGFAALGVAPLPVRLTWTAGVLDPIHAEANDPAVFRQRVERGRANAVAWFAVPLVLFILVIVSSAYGHIAGVVAAGLVALSPNVMAHASLATTDVAFALTFLVGLAAQIHYLRRRSWLSAIAVAAAHGVALATKYSAIGLYLIFVAMLAIRRRETHWKRDLTALAGGLAIAWSLHGWHVAPLFAENGTAATLIATITGPIGVSPDFISALRQLPAPIMLRGIAAQIYLERAGQEAFLLGEVSQFGWWYYFPVAVAMKSTLVELAAFGAFAMLVFRRRWRDVETQVVIVAVLLYGGLALLGRRDLGVRYVLPIMILTIITAVAWGSDLLKGRKWAPAVAGAALAIQAFSFAGIAPEFLAYFNGLAGGPARGYTRLVDSNLDWGQDLLRLRDWLSVHSEVDAGLAYFGSAPLSAYDVQPADWRTLNRPPVDGRKHMFVLSATYLQGIFLCGDPFAGFRAIEPSARIGYSLMVYDVSRDNVSRALGAAAADACAP